MKVSEIKIKVTVDDNHIPIDIKWMATDSGVDHLVDCKAFNLSIWDPSRAIHSASTYGQIKCAWMKCMRTFLGP